MFDISKEEWQEARKRNGNAKEDLPEAVTEAFEETEEIGFRRGIPLIGESYEAYPTVDTVVLPQSKEFVERLVQHGKVQTLNQAVAELSGGTSEDKWRSALRNAIDAFDIDRDKHLGGFEVPEVDSETEGIEGFTTVFPKDIPSPATNPLVVSHLYLLGLSVSQISDHLQNETGASVVSERKVYQTLVDIGLADGTTTATQERRDTGVKIETGSPEPKRDEHGQHPITNVEID